MPIEIQITQTETTFLTDYPDMPAPPTDDEYSYTAIFLIDEEEGLYYLVAMPQAYVYADGAVISESSSFKIYVWAPGELTYWYPYGTEEGTPPELPTTMLIWANHDICNSSDGTTVAFAGGPDPVTEEVVSDVTVPEVTSDWLGTYPYVSILHVAYAGFEAIVALLSEHPLNVVPAGAIEGLDYGVIKVSGFSTSAIYDAASDSWLDGEAEERDFSWVNGTVSEGGFTMTGEVCWTNHNAIVCEVVDLDTFDTVETDEVFMEGTGVVEPPDIMSADRSFFVGAAANLRRILSKTDKYTPDTAYEAWFNDIPVLANISGKWISDMTSSYDGSTSPATVTFTSQAESITVPNYVSVNFHSGYTSVANFPLLTTMGSNVFQRNASLTKFIAPLLTTLGSSAFLVCAALLEVDFPVLTTVNGSAFSGCSKLAAVDFPKLTTCGAWAFNGCSTLKRADIGKVTAISNYAFQGCAALSTLILRGTEAVCTIGTNAFTNCTALASGLIYVPAALVASYQADTSWAALVTDAATQIVSLDYIILLDAVTKTLEFGGSANIEVPYTYYGDGISAVAASGNTGIATVGECTVADGVITIPVTALTTEGAVDITVTASSGDFSVSQTITVTVVEELPDPTYTVEAVSGATYGFALNDDGYYESGNAGVYNSYALCKVTFNTQGWATLYLDCINSGEANYDFGILSNVDTMLALSANIDTTNVFKSFKGASSTDVQTVEYGAIEAGEHYIYVKFRKDGSGNSGNDSLQFKVRME